MRTTYSILAGSDIDNHVIDTEIDNMISSCRQCRDHQCKTASNVQAQAGTAIPGNCSRFFPL